MSDRVQGTTKSGFKFDVDKAVVDDMELVDALSELQEGNGLATSKIVKMILGEDQKKALYDHLRGESGRVSTTAVSTEVTEILNSIGEKVVKN